MIKIATTVAQMHITCKLPDLTLRSSYADMHHDSYQANKNICSVASPKETVPLTKLKPNWWFWTELTQVVCGCSTSSLQNSTFSQKDSLVEI